MEIEIRPYEPADLEMIRGLFSSPSLAQEFDALLRPDMLDDLLADPFFDAGASWIASVEGEPAGFCLTFILPHARAGKWVLHRMGVVERYRRRGLGTALLEAARDRLAAQFGPGGPHAPREVRLSAWLPNPAAHAFAAHHGFRYARTYWRLARPVAPAPPVEWPPGVDGVVFDGGEAAFADWNNTYNVSFADEPSFIPSTVELCRTIAAEKHFLAAGLVLAYRGGRCVGFCRNEREGSTGVVSVLGVVPEARGIGLGRALLRWGVAYFAAGDVDRIGLVVDADNGMALGLYRSEGFEVVRTREMWARPFLPA